MNWRNDMDHVRDAHTTAMRNVRHRLHQIDSEAAVRSQGLARRVTRRIPSTPPSAESAPTTIDHDPVAGSWSIDPADDFFADPDFGYEGNPPESWLM
ncbi:hypothetical protein [Nocardia sp. NPDC057440]|uniref:hypothetical protein n=1 Tax=Nocardia sp. NPDC057440 TaxID=3346134 RepID=UPI0036717751